jgi:hypothetical protein
MSTRYFLDPASGQLLATTEPDRCATYWKLAGQAHQTDHWMPGFREIQLRMQAHLNHCTACSDWFAMHFALGEAVEEPVFGELPAAEPAAPVKEYIPRQSRNLWKTMPRRDGQKLDRLYAMFGRSA